MQFTVQRANGIRLPDMPVTLNLAGEHNVLNALAAIAAVATLIAAVLAWRRRERRSALRR